MYIYIYVYVYHIYIILYLKILSIFTCTLYALDFFSKEWVLRNTRLTDIVIQSYIHNKNVARSCQIIRSQSTPTQKWGQHMLQPGTTRINGFVWNLYMLEIWQKDPKIKRYRSDKEFRLKCGDYCGMFVNSRNSLGVSRLVHPPTKTTTKSWKSHLEGWALNDFWLQPATCLAVNVGVYRSDAGCCIKQQWATWKPPNG